MDQHDDSDRRDGIAWWTARQRELRWERELISRRALLARAARVSAGAGTAAALASSGVPLIATAQEETFPAPPELPPLTDIPEALKGEGELTVCSDGGSFQDAQREAYFKPFEELSGITVREAEGPDPARIKAMVDTGNVDWDIVELDHFDILNLNNEGDYWEPIDYDLFDTENIDESWRHELSVGMLPYAWILAYRTDEFGDNPPRTWADFWDTEAFPGPRSLTAASGRLTPNLEFALLADGVAPDEIYPIDIDRAYESMSRVRNNIVKFWESGAMPAQMITDREVVLTSAWNGRIALLQQQGVSVGMAWDRGMLTTDVWGIPKGARNRENAMKFAAFTTLAVPQARLSMLIPYGFTNDAAAEYIPDDWLALLPTAPAQLEQMFIRDIEWWVANVDEVVARWNEWILG